MKKNYFILGLMAVLLVSLSYGCKKENEDDDDDDTQLTGRAAWVGSYDFTVNYVDHNWNNILQQCEDESGTSTYLIIIDTLSSDNTLLSNQLVIKNLRGGSSSEEVIDISGDSFLITGSSPISGSGTKNGNTITIEFSDYSSGICDPSTGNGTATKRP